MSFLLINNQKRNEEIAFSPFALNNCLFYKDKNLQYDNKEKGGIVREKHPNSEPPQKNFMVETVNFQLMNMFEWYRQKASFLKRLAGKTLSPGKLILAIIDRRLVAVSTN